MIGSFVRFLLLTRYERIVKLTRSLRSLVRLRDLSQLVNKNRTHSPTMK